MPVITGLGIVSPIGVGVSEFWRAALAGTSGIGPIAQCRAENLPAWCRIAAEVKGFDPGTWGISSTNARIMGRFTQYAIASSRMALRDSGLEGSTTALDHAKVVFGTCMSGLVDVQQPTFEAFLQGGRVVPWVSHEYPGHAAASHVAHAVGARGQTSTIATLCSGGLDAIGWGAEQVWRGSASVVIAGGAETPLSDYTMTAFHAAGVLSRWRGEPERACRPFDALRSGLVIGEGAAAVIIEEEEHARRRGARIYATIAGYESASEGGHLHRTDMTGETAARAMDAALAQAGIKPGDIDYVCAHGNAMVDYDAAETTALKRTFGRHAYNFPVSSLKAMCGQAFSASGAIQVVATCLVLRDGTVFPTINLDYPDPACDLDYVPNRPRRARVGRALVHSHAMGGSHSALILDALA
jgi:3-oxoacyl-[acyl-carrier-protein] synthase II